MPGFNNNIPQPNDDLSVSQGDLLLNFQSCNTSFAVDHYPFTDLTINDGKHNKVTTPVISPNAYPTTLATNATLFGYQEPQAGSTLPIGIIQYSRGPSNAVPSPITYVQGPLPFTSVPVKVGVNNGVASIIDFTGLKDCLCQVVWAPVNVVVSPSSGVPNTCMIHYFLRNGVTPTISANYLSLNVSGLGHVELSANGAILRLSNPNTTLVASIGWSIQIYRILQLP